MTFAARNFGRFDFARGADFQRGASVYAGTARFDGTARAMTEDELRKAAPSIFALTAHESRSERFQPIPTIEIIRGLAKEGFAVVGAKQSACRTVDKRDYTKHLLRLRKLDDVKKYSVGDSIFEMLLKNANDGTSVYDLFGGIFKIACANSLVSCQGEVDSIKVRHSGDVQSKVIEGTYSVLRTAETVLAAPQDWSQIRLDRDERMALAEAAHVLRFADAEGEVHTAIKPQQLLAPKRQQDVEPNLWNVFNVVQEHCIKGGDSAIGTGSNGQRRKTTSREVKGIDQDVRLNKALWTLSAKMAELKAAA